MKKSYLFLVTILLCISNFSFAQAPVKLWDKTFGGSNDEFLKDIIQTNDGGYLLGGYTSSNISGDKSENSIGGWDFWILKTDAEGNKLWDKTLGGSSDEQLHSIVQTIDGGYLLAGYSPSIISGDKSEAPRGLDDYWIIKTDASGNKQWDKTLGGSSGDHCKSVIQTSDGGYLLAGSSSSGISFEKSEEQIVGKDYWIIKTDASGNKQWDKTLGGNSADLLESVIQTTDGCYLLAGRSYSSISYDKSEDTKGNGDYWIVKIDVEGNKLWD